METIEQFKEELQKELSIDKIADEIVLKFTEGFHEGGGLKTVIKRSYKHYSLMREIGLVNDLNNPDFCILTNKAEDLYKKLKEEGYYLKK